MNGHAQAGFVLATLHGPGKGYVCSCGKEYAFSVRQKDTKRDLDEAFAAHVADAHVVDLQAHVAYLETVAREGHGCTFEDPPIHAAYVDCIGSDCDWRVYVALAGTVGPFVNDALAAHAAHVADLLAWPRPEVTR